MIIEWIKEMKWLLILLLVCIIILVGIFVNESKAFNDGHCQVCNGDVIPVGHQYTTDYYCPTCKRYNQ